jgi:transposase
MMGEFERSIIGECTRAGFDAAKANGRRGGRPRALSEKDLAVAKALLGDGDIPVAEIAKRLKVATSTLYRYMPAARSNTPGKQHSIRETLLIAGRNTTIYDEIRRGADVRTQIVHGKTPDGLRPERHVVIIRHGHYADEYEISAADFRQLRAMGVLAEAEKVPAATAGPL